MRTRGNNADAHPGLCDIDLPESSAGGPAQATLKKRKRAPAMTKEQKEAKREKTVAAVKTMGRFEAQMSSKAAQDLHTPQHTSTRRTGSYIAPDPDLMSELTELDHETASEAPTEMEQSEGNEASVRKPKKKKSENKPKKAGLRDAIAASQVLHPHGSDEDTVSTRPA